MSRQDVIAALGRLTLQADYSAYTAVTNALDAIDSKQSELPPVRLAIVSNFTFDPLLPVLKGEMALAGFHPEIYMGGYDTIAQEVLNPASGLYAFQPDLVIVALWLEPLSPLLAKRFVSLSVDQVAGELERITEEINEFLSALRRYSKAAVLVNNFPLPAQRTLGILDAQSPQYHTHTILRLNDMLLDSAKKTPDAYLVDYLSLMARIGSLQGIDERYWHIGRAPISRHALVPLGQEYGRFIRALKGKPRKCLVLDCDNILWGGVLGEDGSEGIKLGASYPGSCYQAFQREVLNLRDRGVLLALCSKNNEADVLDVLRRHPDMLLRENHFSAFQINWEDKATNLTRIAGDLNIGLDSLVFVDDSAFECDWVRERLPEVSVLQLSESSSFCDKLTAKGYFDSLVFSTEDKQRSELYSKDVERKQLKSTASSLEDYLTKLEMVAQITRLNEGMVSRISQLTQKTNQFNLTTHRYSEGEIRALMGNDQYDVYGLHLRDRISDMGLVGVAIVRYSGEQAEIDTFLLSCRVLGRDVEQAFLVSILNKAREKGCQRVIGRYLPTKKNGQTADFYKRQGFQLLRDTPEGSDWEMVLKDGLFSGPRWIDVKLNEAEEKSCKPMSKS